MTRHQRHTLDAVGSHGSGLRVEFFRQGIRWAHRVLAVEGQLVVPLLESLEGDDSQFFPPSPALQQLAFQDLGDRGQVALLVGMAGKNHWSVGVEAERHSGTIRFDVACQNQLDGVGRLGSVYKPLAPWRSGHATAPPTGGLVALRKRVCYALAAALQERTNRLEIRVSDDQLVDLHVSVDTASCTQRWCYEVRRLVGERT